MPCCNIWEVFEEENNLIKEYKYWKVLVRKNNFKLGSCVAITKKHHDTFSEISSEEMAEYALIMKEFETAIKKSFKNDAIHHLALMLKDHHTHFHIIPRYKKSKTFAGEKWIDDYDPDGALGKREPPLSQKVLQKIKEEIISNLP